MANYDERRGSALYAKEVEMMLQTDPNISITSKKEN
jgi:hypothetical protein